MVENSKVDGNQLHGGSKKPDKFFGVRHIQFCLLFILIFISYGMRTVLSIAIIAMIDKNPPNPSVPTYPEWGATDRILSSFFWGYMVPQIGAGQLAERFGPKWFLSATITIGAICNFAIPPMAESLGQNGVMICRIILGLSQGFLYPSINHLLSKWVPENERLIVTNILFNAANLGIALSTILTGYLADTQTGWPLAFYLHGASAILWVFAWSWFGCNSPAEHFRISQEELKHIEANLRATTNFDRKAHGTPWLEIIKSKPVWAILIVQFGIYWGTFTLFTELPTYLDSIMGFSLKQNSLLASLPYLATWILSFISSPLAHKLLERTILSITNVRKVFQLFGSFVPAIALIILAFIDSSQKVLGIFLLMVAVGSAVGSFSGCLVNHIDLAPNYAGTLLGICNSIATIASILGPLTVGFFGDDKKDPVLWRKVFCLAAGIMAGTGVVYGIFGSGEKQPWNDSLDSKKDEKEEGRRR